MCFSYYDSLPELGEKTKAGIINLNYNEESMLLCYDYTAGGLVFSGMTVFPVPLN